MATIKAGKVQGLTVDSSFPNSPQTGKSVLRSDGRGQVYVFDGSRWRGFAGQPVPDFLDDFTSDNMLQEGTQLVVDDTTDERIEGNPVSAAFESLSHDLQTLIGEAVDDTAFVIRFTLNLLTFVQAANDDTLLIGISDEDASVDTETTASHFVGFRIRNSNAGERTKIIHATNETINETGATNGGFTPSDATLMFVEMSWDGTTFTVKISDGDEFDGDLMNKSTTADTGAAINTPRFFKIMNRKQDNGGTFTFMIDNFKFWNGISSIDESIAIEAGIT